MDGARLGIVRTAKLMRMGLKADDVVFGPVLEELDQLGIPYDVVSGEELAAGRDEGWPYEALLGTWGFPSLTAEFLASQVPQLRFVGYAAGSVKSFAKPLLEAGIRVSCARRANARPVAEFVFSQILLATKGYFRVVLDRSLSFVELEPRLSGYPGNFRTKVGLVGVGAVTEALVALLKLTDLEVLAWDPIRPEEDLRTLGLTPVSLEQLFSEALVVSNHLPDLPATRNLLVYPLLARLGPQATFINTGRGPQVDEAALARALNDAPGRTALLDVTVRQQLPEESPLFACPNLIVSPHMAGSEGWEPARMGLLVLEEYLRFRRGDPLDHEVTLGQWDFLA